MPNWVHNTVEIKGNENRLSELRSKLKTHERDNGDITYQIGVSLFPLPNDISYVFGTGDDIKYAILQDKIVRPPSVEEYVTKSYDERIEFRPLTSVEKKKLMEEHGATNWYDWNIKTYGTKWADVDTQLVSESPTRLVFEFDTAWSPSFSLSGRISDEYKLEVLHKHWSIENMSEGNAKFNNGRIVEEYWREIDESELTFEPIIEEE